MPSGDLQDLRQDHVGRLRAARGPGHAGSARRAAVLGAHPGDHEISRRLLLAVPSAPVADSATDSVMPPGGAAAWAAGPLPGGAAVRAHVQRMVILGSRAAPRSRSPQAGRPSSRTPSSSRPSVAVTRSVSARWGRPSGIGSDGTGPARRPPPAARAARPPARPRRDPLVDQDAVAGAMPSRPAAPSRSPPAPRASARRPPTTRPRRRGPGAAGGRRRRRGRGPPARSRGPVRRSRACPCRAGAARGRAARPARAPPAPAAGPARPGRRRPRQPAVVLGGGVQHGGPAAPHAEEHRGGLPVHRQGDRDGAARADVELVLQQVGRLGHPVGQRGRRQLDPLPGRVVVVRDQRGGRSARPLRRAGPRAARRPRHQLMQVVSAAVRASAPSTGAPAAPGHLLADAVEVRAEHELDGPGGASSPTCSRARDGRRRASGQRLVAGGVADLGDGVVHRVGVARAAHDEPGPVEPGGRRGGQARGARPVEDLDRDRPGPRSAGPRGSGRPPPAPARRRARRRTRAGCRRPAAAGCSGRPRRRRPRCRGRSGTGCSRR